MPDFEHGTPGLPPPPPDVPDIGAEYLRRIENEMVNGRPAESMAERINDMVARATAAGTMRRAIDQARDEAARSHALERWRESILRQGEIAYAQERPMPMPQTREGMCVGGPANGRMMALQGTTPVQFAEPVRARSFTEEAVSPYPISTNLVTYTVVERYSNGRAVLMMDDRRDRYIKLRNSAEGLRLEAQTVLTERDYSSVSLLNQMVMDLMRDANEFDEAAERLLEPDPPEPTAVVHDSVIYEPPEDVSPRAFLAGVPIGVDDSLPRNTIAYQDAQGVWHRAEIEEPREVLRFVTNGELGVGRTWMGVDTAAMPGVAAEPITMSFDRHLGAEAFGALLGADLTGSGAGATVSSDKPATTT